MCDDGALAADSEICVRIDEFTDPTCPWAFSEEPARRRLRWLYEDRIEWVPRMVVLADDAEAQRERGFDPAKVAAMTSSIAAKYRMPIVSAEREYVPGSRKACKAVVAVREHAGKLEARLLLRALRVVHFSGELIDRDDVILAAATEAGTDHDDLAEWIADPATEAALETDIGDARAPSPAARVLDEKLANWSGGRRYTCPSYEITRLEDGVRITVPGFQPFAVYDTILANLVPGVDRRPLPGSAKEVLEWSAVPVSTQEVAAMRGIGFDEAREELGRITNQRHVGADGYWTLDG